MHLHLPALSLETLHCEQAVVSEPFVVKSWLQYLKHVAGEKRPSLSRSFAIHERSVAALPGSFKLWRLYRAFAHRVAASLHPEHPSQAHLRDVVLRAARATPHCPEPWEDALSVCIKHNIWTAVRPILNEAVAAVPVTLHHRLWSHISTFVVSSEEKEFPLFAVHCLKRSQVLLFPLHGQRKTGDASNEAWQACQVQLFRALRELENIDEAVVTLSTALKQQQWSKDSQRELCAEVLELAVRHPQKCVSIDVPALVRSSIETAEAEVGELWASLGEVYTRQGLFLETRNTFEEALTKLFTLRDFAVVFDAYAKFLESLVVAAMGSAGEDESEDESEDDANEGYNGDVANSSSAAMGRDPLNRKHDRSEKMASNEESVDKFDPMDAESVIAALEALTVRRPLLLSDVCLRQNPHNVHEWRKRASLYQSTGDLAGTVAVFEEAVGTVDPWRASHGRSLTLWLSFAKVYEDDGDFKSARAVFSRAVSDPERFKAADDLATVWCEFAEMELRNSSVDAARDVLKRGTSKPNGFVARERALKLAKEGRLNPKSSNVDALLGAGAGHISVHYDYDNSSPAWHAWKSIRVWSMLLDLEESAGSVKDVLDIHERMLDLGNATPDTVIHGAVFLQSRRYFEQAFKLLDRGTSVFQWAGAFRVWILYLKYFTARYGNKKIERARDLFETAIKQAPLIRRGNQRTPNPDLKLLYLMFAKMEETYGFAHYVMAVYSRAVKSVAHEQRADMYRIYIVRATELWGVTKARSIYEEALEELPRREDIVEFALRYAALETRVGEIDRARAIYMHGAEVADPRAGPRFADYWTAWNSFELAHGSEDTFRDMLRKKRYVQMQNAGSHLVTSVAAGAGTVEAAAVATTKSVAECTGSGKGAEAQADTSAMKVLEHRVLAAKQADDRGEESTFGKLAGNSAANSEEIELDLDDEASDTQSREVKITDIPVQASSQGVVSKDDAAATPRTVENGEGDVHELNNRPLSRDLVPDGTGELLGARERLKRKREGRAS